VIRGFAQQRFEARKSDGVSSNFDMMLHPPMTIGSGFSVVGL
jgi:hypothetical protein